MPRIHSLFYQCAYVSGCVFSLAEASFSRAARVSGDGEWFFDSGHKSWLSARTKRASELSEDDGEMFMLSEQRKHGALRQKRQHIHMKKGKDRCLILYHIPKSAGTSLQHFFTDKGLRLWTHYGIMTDETALPTSDRDSKPFEPLDADVFMGHFTPDFRRKLREFGMTRNCYEATVLRDPLERVASALYYHHPQENQNLYTQRMSHPSADNVEYFDDICRRFDHSTSWNSYDKSYRNSYRIPCDLTKAKAQLSALDFVLFTSDYQKTLTTLGAIFGNQTLPSSSAVENSSKNPGFRKLKPKLRSLIRKANKEDSLLYSWAEQRWEGLVPRTK